MLAGHTRRTSAQGYICLPGNRIVCVRVPQYDPCKYLLLVFSAISECVRTSPMLAGSLHGLPWDSRLEFTKEQVVLSCMCTSGTLSNRI